MLVTRMSYYLIVTDGVPHIGHKPLIHPFARMGGFFNNEVAILPIILNHFMILNFPL